MQSFRIFNFSLYFFSVKFFQYKISKQSKQKKKQSKKIPLSFIKNHPKIFFPLKKIQKPKKKQKKNNTTTTKNNNEQKPNKKPTREPPINPKARLFLTFTNMAIFRFLANMDLHPHRARLLLLQKGLPQLPAPHLF